MKGCRGLCEDCFICLKFSSVHNKCVICSVFWRKMTNTFTQQAQVDCLPVCTPTVASEQQG